MAAECLLAYQKSSGCRGTQLLTLAGVVEVNTSQVKDYCADGACAKHTMGVLQCIHSVKRTFHFANKAKPIPMYYAIADACSTSSALSQSSYITSSAIKLFASSWISFLSGVASMALLMIMKL
ncbi:hypothetical protein V6N12_051205 [Hibiscus sabdariffa]|uniref:DUF7731 domain-containing protein n=1 Tax=Hibiscus sabdariffa TaxID=183260 RepID=A0ABR2GGG9_9ROSI